MAIEGVVPYPGGLELQPLVGRLTAFAKPQAWSIYLRRALLSLPSADASVIDRGLRPLLATPDEAIPTYPFAAETVKR